MLSTVPQRKFHKKKLWHIQNPNCSSFKQTKTFCPKRKWFRFALDCANLGLKEHIGFLRAIAFLMSSL